jgi:hypothetical protein
METKTVLETMTEFRCDCGGNAGHSRPEQCSANRSSTQGYMGRIALQPLVETRDMRSIRESREDEEKARIVGGVYNGMTEAEAIAARDAYNRLF